MTNKGFSLIEVMVTLGIMSIISLGMMTQMEVGMLQQSTIEQKAAVTALTQVVSMTALDTVSCTQAITVKPQAYTALSNGVRFDLPDGHVIANSHIQTDMVGLKVNDFTFGNGALVVSGTDGTKVYYGTLTMNLEATRPVLGPKNFASRVVGSVYLTVAPAGLVVQCGALIPPIVADILKQNAEAEEAQADADQALETAKLKSECLLQGGEFNEGKCTIKHGCGG